MRNTVPQFIDCARVATDKHDIPMICSRLLQNTLTLARTYIFTYRFILLGLALLAERSVGL